MRTHNPADLLAQALTEPSRRALLALLRLQPMSVSQLVEATQMKQPNVSNHLAKMRQLGMVRAERRGRQVFYTLTSPIAEVLLHLHETTLSPWGEEVKTPPQERTPASAVAPANLKATQRAFCEAILQGQEEQALTILNTLLMQRLSLQTIYQEIFEQSLYQIGDRYQQGLADVAQEHLASALIERMMAKVVQFYAPVGRTQHRAVLGCVAGNWHALGLRMLADGLREAGWETFFLGANVPTTNFLNMVATMTPELVVISCGGAGQWEELQHLTQKLHALRSGKNPLSFQVALGGFALNQQPEQLQHLPHDFTAPHLTAFLATVSARFPSPPLP